MRRLRSVLVVEAPPVRRTEAMERELDELNTLERFVQGESERLDRLQRALVGAHPGHLVILAGMPRGTWARLPMGWQALRELSLLLRRGPVPEDVEGAVAVSKDLAEEIVG